MKDSATLRRQWLGFLLGPVTWTVYFVIVYVLDEMACKLSFLSPTAVFPVTTLFTLLSLGVIGYGGWLAYQAWQQGGGDDDEEGTHFLGITGLLLSGLFLLATVAVWVSAWVLMPC